MDLEYQYISNYYNFNDVPREEIRDLMEYSRNFLNDKLKFISVYEFIEK